MRTRAVVDLRSGDYRAVAISTAGSGGLRRVARELWLPASLAAAGLIIGLAALSAPAGIRVPAEVTAGLVAPGALYFLSFSPLRELPIRLGATIIAVLASWTAVGTAGFAIRHALYGPAPASDGAVALMLVVVYLLGLGSLAMMRSRRASSPSPSGPDPVEDAAVSPPSRDEIEHPSGH